MEACSHHSCSYGINYDRLSMINELIPIIWSAVYVCVCKRVCTLVIHYCGQNLSIHTAGIHHHLPLTFLIAIDLFAGHKYLYWNPLLSWVLTHTHTHKDSLKSYCSLSAWLSSGANVMNYSTVLCAAYSCHNIGQTLPEDGSISPRHGCEE